MSDLAALQEEIAELRLEREQAEERAAAVRDVIQTIARTEFDLDAVLHTVIDRAVRDYGAVGNVAILASRLSDVAAPGEILLSQRTHAALDDRIGGEPVSDLRLKGFSRPVVAMRLTGLRR